ncbi:biotin/lipoyl-containing protein [Streptomyces sp. NPDC059467]|uniref:biotin/lipoyl-containing protein n=1 Tax=Streptomyces sp. NPDC059467 TaxID=3346844 RepID=UPI00368EBCD2
MAVSVAVPALGESVTEGTVTRWLKQVGETAQVEEHLLEASAGKAERERQGPRTSSKPVPWVGTSRSWWGSCKRSVACRYRPVPAACPVPWRAMPGISRRRGSGQCSCRGHGSGRRAGRTTGVPTGVGGVSVCRAGRYGVPARPREV